MMKNRIALLCLFLYLPLVSLISYLFYTFPAKAARLKDIANIQGARSNQLIGYGLVVGLAGTGDGTSEYTNKSLQRMLNRLGVKVKGDEISSKSVAAVLVTAKLPPFSRSGNRIDVTVNVLGQASSLKGGTLIQTPLRAADEQIYAVAQGSISLGSPHSESEYKTVGRIPNGAIIEREVKTEFLNKKMYRLTLYHPDFTTAARVAKKINIDLGGYYATAIDAATIDLSIPSIFKGRGVELLALVESLDVSPDTKARVVVNEKTGSVVIGKNVRISRVAISYGHLSLRVGSKSKSQNKGRKNKKKNEKSLDLLEESVRVEDVVKGLNRLGVSSRDLITIFQNIKSAGALQGDLEIL